MKKHILIVLIAFCSLASLQSYGQNVKISGTVVSQNDHQPLVGATVTVRGTSIGTVTDQNGNFTISADSKDRLVVSNIGFKSQSVLVDHKQTVDIVLQEDDSRLDEVVITALGISKEKKSLGYSVQELKSGRISSANEQNLVNDLTGKIAGVQVTNSQGGMGSSRIVIRGETSISGNNQPLFIIDGVPVDNSQLRASDSSRDFANAISDINSEDIESISVLKGPNAAALYGSRAANGVILIKTKTGKGKKGLGVSVYSNTTFENVLELPKYQNLYGQGNGGQFTYVDGKGGGINDGVDESWGPKLDGRLIPQFYSNGVAVPFVAHPNNVRDYFETGHTFTNGVAFTGAGDVYDYRFSYNNSSEKGINPNTDLTKHNFGFNTSYKILPNLVLSTNANYIINSSGNLPGAFGRRSSSTMLQFTWFGRQVDVNQLKNYLDSNGNPINWNNSYYSNPYFIAYNNTVSQRRDRIFGNVNLNYKFWENFTANLRIGNDHYNDRRKIRIAYGTNGTPYGSYQETAYALNENNVELTLDYNKKLSDDFALDILAGGNLQSNYYESNDQKAPKLAVSGLYTLNNSRDPLVSSSYYSQQKKNSVFSSGQLSFRNYAFLNVTARNDWSSTLPVQNNSYFYPSANASVILSDALDIKSDALSYLKVRGGWSKVGKDSDPYLLVNTYPFNTPFGSNPLLTVNDKSLNSKLKPETTSSSEVGTEIGLFNNRVKVDLSYYNTNSYNQILNLDVSPSTGYNSKLLNAGKINNRGFEAQLNVTPVSTNGFKWDVTANFATNRSKVLKLDDAGLLQSYRIDTYDVDIVAPIGQKYGTLLGTAYLRNDKGQIVVDANGIPEADSNRKSLGSFQPKWTGGVTNTFSYKGVTLSFLVDAKVGGSLYSGSYATGLYTGVLAQTLPGRDAEHGGLAYYYSGNNKSTSPVQLIGSASVPNGETVYHDGIIFKGVTESGAANTAILPAEQYYKALYGIDEHNVFSSTYVKLRELTLGFALPSKWTSKLGASSASLSFIGRNLWIIHKNVPNIDPETALNTGNGQGQEDLTLPTTRSLGFSLRLNF